jgi:hypothetical protein
MLIAQTCEVETSLQALVAAMNTWVTSYHQKVKNNCLVSTINKQKRDFCFENNKITVCTTSN